MARSLREISCFGTYESGVQFLILVLFNLVIIDVLDYLLFYVFKKTEGNSNVKLLVPDKHV